MRVYPFSSAFLHPFIPNDQMAPKTTPVRMDGRMCVLTGATSGVGYHAAKQLAKGGVRLVLVYRNAEKAALVKKELECEQRTSVRTRKSFKNSSGAFVIFRVLRVESFFQESQ